MVSRLLNRLLGILGRSSRLDLDQGAAREFDAPVAIRRDRPELRVIAGGRDGVAPIAANKKPPHRHAS